MSRWLPYMPTRWRNAAIALAAIAVAGRVIEVIARPTDVAVAGIVVTVVLTAVFGYAIVYIVFVVVSLVRK